MIEQLKDLVVSDKLTVEQRRLLVDVIIQLSKQEVPQYPIYPIQPVNPWPVTPWQPTWITSNTAYGVDGNLRNCLSSGATACC